jgi:uncharacterized protein
MSQETVEFVRRAFAAGIDDDYSDLIAGLDENVEMLGAVGGFEEGKVTRGRAAVARELALDTSVWAERRYEVQRLIDAGDQIVAVVHEYRRGRASGIEISADMALIYSFRDGKVFRIEPYMSQSEALEAAGLSE